MHADRHNADHSELVAHVDQAIRERRTSKKFRPQPLEREEIEQLLDLARWAPNHTMNQPWRFRVLGPRSLERLKRAAGSGAKKLERAPTLILVTAMLSEGPVQAEEDKLAAACAAYIILLGATARGHGSYWRTPGVLRSDEGRRACDLDENEYVVGLIHLGPAAGEVKAPDRGHLGEVATFLD